MTAVNDKNSNGDKHHSNNKSRLRHRCYFLKDSSTGKQPSADAIPGKLQADGPSVGVVYYNTTACAWRSLTTETKLNLVFHVENLFSVFRLALPLAINESDKNREYSR